MNVITFNFNNKNCRFNLRDEVDQSVFAEIFRHREYRAADEIIISALDPIVDIGAHAGFFSVYCRALNDEVKIFAVEPEKNNLEFLELNSRNNNIKNIKIVAGAIGETSRKGLLKISPDNHNHKITAPLFIDAKNNNQQTQKIDIYSLPDLFKKLKIKKAALIKMDIEGEEFSVFESLPADFFAVFKSVILEYHNSANKHYKAIEICLRQNGFGVQIFPSRFDKSMGFIFATNKRI